MLGGIWILKDKLATFEHVERTKGDYPSVSKILQACGATPEQVNISGFLSPPTSLSSSQPGNKFQNCFLISSVPPSPRGFSSIPRSATVTALATPRQNRKSWLAGLKAPKIGKKKEDGDDKHEIFAISLGHNESETPGERNRNRSASNVDRYERYEDEDIVRVVPDLTGLENELLKKPPLKRTGSTPACNVSIAKK